MKVGIDPGLSGAIAFVGDEGIFLQDLPLKECTWIKPKPAKRKVNKRTGKVTMSKPKPILRVDTVKLEAILKNCPYEIESVTMEIVHTMPKQGIASAFTFGGSFYAAISAVESAGLGEPKMVFPQYWKKKHGLLCLEKDASRLLALKMYPHLKPMLKLKKNHGKADALFIAIS